MFQFSCNQPCFLYNYSISQCEIFFPTCTSYKYLKYTDKLCRGVFTYSEWHVIRSLGVTLEKVLNLMILDVKWIEV